jgi:hypothetical protein
MKKRFGTTADESVARQALQGFSSGKWASTLDVLRRCLGDNRKCRGLPWSRALDSSRTAFILRSTNIKE